MKGLWQAGAVVLCVLGLRTPLSAQPAERARDLGVPFEGTPGPLNAITDVPGVEVGYFSTANPGADVAPRPFQRGVPPSATPPPLVRIAMLPNWAMNPLFDATVQATEEAIVNSMVGARTMTGIDGNRITAVPHDTLRELMKESRNPTAW